MAKALDYEFAAYVLGNLETAWAVAERLNFSAVGVNVNDTRELRESIGTWKTSRFGREPGPEGLMTFLEQKHLKIRVRPLTLTTG